MRNTVFSTKKFESNLQLEERDDLSEIIEILKNSNLHEIFQSQNNFEDLNANDKETPNPEKELDILSNFV